MELQEFGWTLGRIGSTVSALIQEVAPHQLAEQEDGITRRRFLPDNPRACMEYADESAYKTDTKVGVGSWGSRLAGLSKSGGQE